MHAHKRTLLARFGFADPDQHRSTKSLAATWRQNLSMIASQRFWLNISHGKMSASQIPVSKAASSLTRLSVRLPRRARSGSL